MLRYVLKIPGQCTASALPEASFIAETSFVDAPLNSRLANTATSRQERLTTKRLRQIITKSSNDKDDESDLQQLDDQAEPDEEDGKVVWDDISQADLVIQEALLVEDLLGVLIVSLNCKMCRSKPDLPSIRLFIGCRGSVHTH